MIQVFSKMQREESLYPAFKRSQQYVKLLAELDLLREPSIQSEDTFPVSCFHFPLHYGMLCKSSKI